MRFRFDDVSSNTDMGNLNELSQYIHQKFPKAEIQYAVSPLVFNIKTGDIIERQRVFPKIFGAHSDHRIYFAVDGLGIPMNIPDYVEVISHGLFHVDSRLLTKEQQEMNIIAGCSLVKSKVFAPPFSKYNNDTISICKEHGIELQRFSDGWLCGEHETWKSFIENWYFHPRLWSIKKLKVFFGDEE